MFILLELISESSVTPSEYMSECDTDSWGNPDLYKESFVHNIGYRKSGQPIDINNSRSIHSGSLKKVSLMSSNWSGARGSST